MEELTNAIQNLVEKHQADLMDFCIHNDCDRFKFIFRFEKDGHEPIEKEVCGITYQGEHPLQ